MEIKKDSLVGRYLKNGQLVWIYKGGVFPNSFYKEFGPKEKSSLKNTLSSSLEKEKLSKKKIFAISDQQQY